MAAFSPLSPGLWLMRRMRWLGKVAWGTVLALLAVVLAGLSAPYWLTATACALMLYVQLALWVSMAQDMEAVAGSMRKTTQGDLTVHASLQSRDEMGDMARSLDQMVYKLSAMVADIRSNAALQAEALEQRASTLNQAVAAFRLQQGTAEEAVALVRKAVALRRSSPREQFLGRITDKAAGFHDRDMYVFVLDEAGRYLAFGGNPSKVGTRVQDIPGIAGDQLVHDIVTQAQQGPGWVEYDITNPATGVVQTKMSFVSQVDDWY
eukprot:gene13295-13073_t